MTGLRLYGHPFSSYTWKALIPLYANDTPFTFCMVDPDHPENGEFVRKASPQGKFPLLADGDKLVFEATSIIEHLQNQYPGRETLIPADADAAAHVRMLDRVFDNYVMNLMQPVVDEHIRNPQAPDQIRIAEVYERLPRSYAWLERWLATYPVTGRVTLIECAAAPSLFYADWVLQIGDEFPALAAWRQHLLNLPAVARCVDEARPYRAYFPPGAPDRD
ncbi:MAG: glutathione S-transferase family protein [Novosphingobium sp.]